ncbi:hypothetical protein P4391_21455 [Bacillus thuringiensis]|uniref:Uncharacterized protein n=1 Tax=Bacillus thuringiensis serovar toumanoffi TaxID=180862 RepID=A0ABD5HS99_BACTU|nr:hypothetical protein [Bacillus thuringiensis]AMR88135.1 hypothetical protein A3L20_29360 [Bacillus thuringiensis]MBG9634610.1 hypothetical protein [Bacillus thuringiensis]MBG9673826.1 hypothetical protein [Bacillus thuringiensis]MDW9207753.1 hypothetical protein [Bacillus thuringiensis serovar toumanoffi]MDW9207788.1 hypothetical protein [Bacillus thuringiensis serovar toumanoffi]
MKFMSKTRFTINVDLFDIITFIIVLIGLSIIMTLYATKVVVGYKYDLTLCIFTFVYISIYLCGIYIPTYFVLKPQKTKHTDEKTV